MLNRSRGRRPAQVAFSVRELADLSGMSKGQMERLLETNAVEYRRSGNKRLVFLSNLEAAMPELMDSVRFRGDGDE